MLNNIKELIEPISKFFNMIMHPIQTLENYTEIILLYIPVLCVVILIFYVVTGSKKVLNALLFTILVFVLLKYALVFQMTWLIAVIIAAVLIIRLIGVIM